MILPDVNVLVHAHREDSPHHTAARTWLERALADPEPLGLLDLVLSGFVRVVTHPRVFLTPTPLDLALEFTEHLRASPRAVRVQPGERHWGIFADLCRAARAKGNLIPDAFLAAAAVEAGGIWVSTDREYARFPGLRWQAPF
ncbi:MAG TPA: type II toxin-antitoxin system VapC family toxin [Planctomycetota bacterium]|nr:type II toxin-antitoxin system VapC family toxin [Planctomycetota bacterium]